MGAGDASPSGKYLDVKILFFSLAVKKFDVKKLDAV
jgi:hypothetical protein